MQEQVLFQMRWGGGVGGVGGGWMILFLFNVYKVHHFYIQQLLYSLQNCIMHLKPNYHFLPIVGKGVHTPLS